MTCFACESGDHRLCRGIPCTCTHDRLTSTGARSARIELRPVKTDEYNGLTPALRPHYLTLIADNGEPLAHSEALTTRSAARRAARAWTRAFSQILDSGNPVREFTEVQDS